MPCWMGNTSETSGRVAKDRDLPTKVGWRWKVEEEKDEDDEGSVELTGAYKALQLDLKRLKEKLRYFSKRGGDQEHCDLRGGQIDHRGETRKICRGHCGYVNS